MLRVLHLLDYGADYVSTGFVDCGGYFLYPGKSFGFNGILFTPDPIETSDQRVLATTSISEMAQGREHLGVLRQNGVTHLHAEGDVIIRGAPSRQTDTSSLPSTPGIEMYTLEGWTPIDRMTEWGRDVIFDRAFYVPESSHPTLPLKYWGHQRSVTESLRFAGNYAMLHVSERTTAQHKQYGVEGTTVKKYDVVRFYERRIVDGVTSIYASSTFVGTTGSLVFPARTIPANELSVIPQAYGVSISALQPVTRHGAGADLTGESLDFANSLAQWVQTPDFVTHLRGAMNSRVVDDPEGLNQLLSEDLVKQWKYVDADIAASICQAASFATLGASIKNFALELRKAPKELKSIIGRSRTMKPSTRLRKLKQLGKTKTKSAASAYLEYLYGIAPAVRDLSAVFEGFNKFLAELASPNIWYHSRRTLVLPVSYFSSPVECTFTLSCEREVHSERLKRTVGTDVWGGFLRWGLAPTPNTVYDILAFSFVVDWFVGIGDWVDTHALLNTATHFVLSCVTAGEKGVCHPTGPDLLSDDFVIPESLTIETDVVVTNYVRSVSTSLPIPPGKVGMGSGPLEHWTEGASIIITSKS